MLRRRLFYSVKFWLNHNLEHGNSFFKYACYIQSIGMRWERWRQGRSWPFRSIHQIRYLPFQRFDSTWYPSFTRAILRSSTTLCVTHVCRSQQWSYSHLAKSRRICHENWKVFVFHKGQFDFVFGSEPHGLLPKSAQLSREKSSQLQSAPSFTRIHKSDRYSSANRKTQTKTKEPRGKDNKIIGLLFHFWRLFPREFDWTVFVAGFFDLYCQILGFFSRNLLQKFEFVIIELIFWAGEWFCLRYIVLLSLEICTLNMLKQITKAYIRRGGVRGLGSNPLTSTTSRGPKTLSNNRIEPPMWMY